MTKKIFYEKVGRKYVPVAEYNSDLLDSFTKGSHLVLSYPGGISYRYNIEPALAPMIAAGRFAEEALSKALAKASEARSHTKTVTTAQKKAWKNLAKSFGSDTCYIEIPSAREIAEEGIKALETEAFKLLEHPMVAAAYDEFMATCKLVLEK